MAVYCVTYDLNSPGQKYEQVNKLLSEYNSVKVMRTFWLIDTTQTADQIRQNIGRVVDQNDVVFVSQLSHQWASRHIPNAAVDWLKSSYRSW